MAKAAQKSALLEPGHIQDRGVSSELEREQAVSRSSSENWLDINSLLKAGHILSQTVQLSDLLAEMIGIFLENTGAEKVLILHREEETWFVVASGHVKNHAVDTGLHLPVSEAANLSLSIFNHVINSGKAILLERAARDPRFGAEAYLNEHEVKSVFCLPIYHKGKLDLLIYLENSLTESAFTGERLEFLQLLSGHMAISFENALIYENLRASIADRRRAEEALREANLVVENSPVVLFRWKAAESWPVELVSRNVTQFGYRPEEILSGEVPYSLMVHTDDLNRVAREVRQYSETGEDQFSQEYRLVTKDGRVRWIEDHTVIERDTAGRITHYQGIVIDITERKQTEEALRKLSKMQSVILNNSTVGIAFVRNRVFEWVNPRMPELFGLSMDQIKGTSTRIVYPSEEAYQDFGAAAYPLLARGEKAAFEVELRKGDGSLFWCRMEGNALDASEFQDGSIWIWEDITDRKRAEEKIRHMATHDALTGLPSLRLARDRLSMTLGMARRHKNLTAVMFIDLDGFKTVNDTFGHHGGDYVLSQVAQRLLSCLRETDTVARIGGDEFLLITPGLHVPEDAAKIAEKVTHLVSKPIISDGQPAIVGASIGIALYPNDGEDMDQLIKRADEAMYRIKNRGKNGFCFASTA